jgi:hypothetical protein
MKQGLVSSGVPVNALEVVTTARPSTINFSLPRGTSTGRAIPFQHR